MGEENGASATAHEENGVTNGAESAATTSHAENGGAGPEAVLGANLGATTAEWVACDKCNKWRSIPKHVHEKISDDDPWECQMNPDSRFNACDKDQELPDAEIDRLMAKHEAAGGLDTLSPYDVPPPGQPYKWALVKKNIFYHRKPRQIKADEVLVCDCIPPRDGGMGCGEDCCNRMLAVQCTPGFCPCGDQCGNQVFFRRQYSNVDKGRTGRKGFGLIAGEDMAAGTFLIEYVGEVLEEGAYAERKTIYASQAKRHYYFMSLGGSEVIDASLRGNLGRFINHSCNPNCETQKWQVGGEICIGLFTLKDVKKGGELTFDYNFERYGEKPMKCLCEEAKCRQWIGGAPGITPEEWEEEEYEDEPEPVMLEEEGAPPETFAASSDDDDDGVLLDSDDEGGDEEEARKKRERVRRRKKQQQSGGKRRGVTNPNGPGPGSAASKPKAGGKKGDKVGDAAPVKQEKKPAAAKPGAGSKPKPAGGILGVGVKKAGANRVREFKRPKNFVWRSEVDRRLDEVRSEETGGLTGKNGVAPMLRLIKLAVVSIRERMHAGSARDLSLVLDVVEKTKSVGVKKEMVRLNILGQLGLVVKDMYGEATMLPVLRKILMVLSKLPMTEERLKAAKFGAGVTFADQLRKLAAHPDGEVRAKAGECMKAILGEEPAALMPPPLPRPGGGRPSLDGARRTSLGGVGGGAGGFTSPLPSGGRMSLGGSPWGTPGTPMRGGGGTPGGMMTPLHPGLRTPQRGGVPGTPQYQPVPHTPQYHGVPGTPLGAGMGGPHSTPLRHAQLPPPPGPGGMMTPMRTPGPGMTPLRGSMTPMATPSHLSTPTADRMGNVPWGAGLPSFHLDSLAGGHGGNGLKRDREWDSDGGPDAKRYANGGGLEMAPQLPPPAAPPPRAAPTGSSAAAAATAAAAAAAKTPPPAGSGSQMGPGSTFDPLDEVFEGVVYDVVRRRIGKYKQDDHPAKAFITDEVAEHMLRKYGAMIVGKEREKHDVRRDQGKSTLLTREQIEESIKGFVRQRVSHYMMMCKKEGPGAVGV